MSGTGGLILVEDIDVMPGFAAYHLLHFHKSENSICNQEGEQVCSSCVPSLLLQNSKSYQEQNYFFFVWFLLCSTGLM